MIKSDRWIIRMAQERGMIEPFEAKQVKVVDSPSGPLPVISFGVSSYGYDIRVARQFKVLDPTKDAAARIIDPKNFDISGYDDFEGDVCLLPPHGMAIAQSLEYFRIPRNILVVCQEKSTYARCGIHSAIAPLEPEWEGRLTFGISNTTSRPAKVYAGEGIAQIIFLESDEACQVSYADKQGKYQRQTVLTPPKV
ncbi:MAG TPA: dCTP deaminase [Elusimicrobiota bacterium]|nr:dCTP deaminase [Elusimicrobiota bacterium]